MHALALIPSLLLAALPTLQEADAEFVEHLTPLVGTHPAQWRVVWTNDPATAATISWSTAEAGSDHQVVYAKVTAAGVGARLHQKTHRDGVYTRNDDDRMAPAFYHHARLSGLEPSTTYRFQLESDGVRSAELHFTTAPDDTRPFAILVGGDSRSGWRARCFVNQTIASIAEQDGTVIALSHGGDYVMYGNRWDHWSKWLSHHELTTTASGRVLPIIPTRGNHDIGAPFDEIFDDPGGATLNYFSTRLSADVSLVTLNSNISVAGDQLTWLEAALAEVTLDSRWVLTSYHRPLYPAVKAPGPAKPFWAPLFDFYALDVALESDGHCIKRTMPIRADEPHPGGVVYIGEGGLGVPQRSPRISSWYLQPPAVATNGHHVLRLDFSPEALRMRILRLPALPEALDPANFNVVIPPHDTWSYHAGDAPLAWAAQGYDASAWPLGHAGFGYGDDDDTTVLAEMRGNHSSVYLRRAFDSAAVTAETSLTLMCRYDDAFVAYLNGVEVARAAIDEPAKPGAKAKVHAHEATRFEAFPLVGWRELLRAEGNVLALVGYNRMRSDRDFTLDPWLAGDRVRTYGGQGLALEVVDDFSLPPRDR